MVITAIISVLVGLIVGVLSGLLGLGGGTILVPIFSVLFGLSPVAATGTSLFTIFFTSISGVIARIRARTCAVKVGIALGLGGALTSPIGVYLATLSPDMLVVLAVCAVIVYSMGTTLRKLLRKPANQDHQKEPDGSTDSLQENFSVKKGIQSAAIGVLTGLLSGYVGLGGGFIMIPLMRNILGFSMKRATGTSLMAILFIAFSGSIAQISFGNVDFLVGFSIVIGSIPGAVIGGTLASRFNDKGLSILFLGFLLVAMVLFIVKQFGILG